MATPKDVDDFDAVETAADFVAYLTLLSTEFTEDVERREASGNPYYEGTWAHHDIGTFLERWGAWLRAMAVEGRPAYPKDLIDPPSWTSLARQLNAARDYE